MDRTLHKHCTYSAVQPVHKRGTNRTRLAQELQCHLCAPEKSLSSGVAHVSSLVAHSPAVHHEHIFFLIHSPFYHDTRTRATTDNTIYSKNTQCIINLSKQAWSNIIAIKKNDSGVKTRRVTKTCVQSSPQVMSPKSLRPRRLRLSQGSRGKQIHISYMTHRKNMEKKITEI